MSDSSVNAQSLETACGSKLSENAVGRSWPYFRTPDGSTAAFPDAVPGAALIAPALPHAPSAAVNDTTPMTHLRWCKGPAPGSAVTRAQRGGQVNLTPMSCSLAAR